MQLDNLWHYMQVDMEADKFETQMRQSENRQKLLKNRNFLMEQQNNMKRIENEIVTMQDRLEAIRDEANRLETLLNAAAEQLDANPPQDPEEVRTRSEDIRHLADALDRYETELQKMHRDAETRDRQQKEIRVRAAKAKQEYDQTKTVYDVEFEQDKKKLAMLRARTEKEAENVAPKLLERYRTIKQHCTPPMARLVDGQCSGCFMTLPSATLRKITAGEEIVECDNCGRILYATKTE